MLKLARMTFEAECANCKHSHKIYLEFPLLKNSLDENDIGYATTSKILDRGCIISTCSCGRRKDT